VPINLIFEQPFDLYIVIDTNPKLNARDMKNKILIAILLFCCSFQLSATHYVGGEVSWKCIPGTGKYIFYMDIYRDCSSSAANIGTGPVNLIVYNTPLPNNGTLSSIQLSFVTPEPGSPLGPNGAQAVQPNCNGCVNSSQPISCTTQDQATLEKYTFRSLPITISGKPPMNGWVFGYTAACCRSNDVKNLSNLGSSSMYKAIMYGDGRPSQDPCYDSSPQFIAEVEAIVCEGYDFQFNNNVFDLDYDSLSFKWAEVVNSSSSASQYVPQINGWAAGYSLNEPTPTPAMNPLNKSATIDARTGNVNMFVKLPTSVPANRAGIYVTSTQVDAWSLNSNTGQRVKVATVFRDMPFKVFRCPNINFTFNDVNGNPVIVNGANKPQFIQVNGKSNSKNLDTTIFIGDSLLVDYLVIDTNISPCDTNFLTTVSMEPIGVQFDRNFSNPNGNCNQPPCATMNPAPIGQSKRISDPAVLNTQFKWVTDCAHLANATGTELNRKFQFVFKLADDFCPVPSVNYATLNVTLQLPELPNPPKVFCFKDSGNGISFSFESMNNDPIRNSKYLVYLGQRPISSSTNFSFLSTPIDTIDSYTGVGSISANQLAPGIEYAIRLKQRDSICGLIQLSNYSSILSKSQSDSVQFQLVYQDSILSVQNHFAGNLQWYRNGVAIQNATSKSIQITTTGSYELEVTIGTCTYRSYPYAITTVGNTALKAAISELSVYPNPTTNQINIGGLSGKEQVRNIRVYNLNGELVISEFGERLIDLSALRNQLYIIRVETDSRVVVKKIIKQ